MSMIAGLSPSQLKQVLRDALLAPASLADPIMIEGFPGGGKTSIVHQVCDEVGKQCWVLRPYQHDPVEFTGLPSVVDGKACWLPFGDLLPQEAAFDGALFIDEAMQCDPGMQKVFGSMLDREGIAGKRLPAECRFILAGNRQSDRAGANRMLSHIASRCQRYELLFSLDDWQAWAVSAGVHQTVRSFAGFKGGSFVSFDPAVDINPVPRTWEKVSRALQIRPNAPTAKTDPVMLAIVQGLVGPGPAAEFLAFREHFSLLHGVVDEVFQRPSTVSIGTTDMSVMHALAGAIATRIKERNGKMSDQELGNVVVFGKRCFPKPLQAVLCLQCVSTGCKRFLAVKETQEWIKDNVELIRAWNLTT